jgi:hypothetical protein
MMYIRKSQGSKTGASFTRKRFYGHYPVVYFDELKIFCNTTHWGLEGLAGGRSGSNAYPERDQPDRSDPDTNYATPGQTAQSGNGSTAGEHSIARHDSESAKQFQALVKKPTNVVKEEAKQAAGNGSGVPHAGQTDQMKAPSAVTVLPMPQVTPKPTKPRVGQRAPERDPVGNTGLNGLFRRR